MDNIKYRTCLEDRRHPPHFYDADLYCGGRLIHYNAVMCLSSALAFVALIALLALLGYLGAFGDPSTWDQC